MHRQLSGVVVSWRTRNARKMRRVEVWCADYGLGPVHKGLSLGALYESERQAFERKLRTLLSGRNDRYHILVLCISCLQGAQAGDAISEIKMQYELV